MDADLLRAEENGEKSEWNGKVRVRLTTALLTSGCCHLMSTHQLTGQLLLSSAPAQTRSLIKLLLRHGPINHLMMSYHSDRWVAQRGSDEHVSVIDPHVHVLHCGVPKYTYMGKAKILIPPL